MVAFVTDAANGIGRAPAIAFALEGASVVVADNFRAWGPETTGLIREAGGRHLQSSVMYCKQKKRRIIWGRSSKPLDVLTLPSIMQV
jgi:NAD(P)-dependent dehydrogenase (short-subunit alcohol dehydrogenase family)